MYLLVGSSLASSNATPEELTNRATRSQSPDLSSYDEHMATDEEGDKVQLSHHSTTPAGASRSGKLPTNRVVPKRNINTQ